MSNSMIAVVYHGPDDLRVEERPIPHVDDDEVLLKVLSTGICGTDIRILHGAHRKYPPGTIRIPGHEVVGEIAEPGSQLNDLRAGMRVFVAPNMGCGHCRQCISGNNNRCAQYAAIGVTLDGSFAEYMRVPASAIAQGNLIPVDDSIDPAAAALIEPFACVLRGQEALHIQPGETVLVIGAGPIGIMHALLAQFRGAGKIFISELNPRRSAQAEAFGIGQVIQPAQGDLLEIIKSETGGEGVNVVIVAAPSASAQEVSLELAALGGRINFFGGLPKERSKILFDSNLVHYKELTVTGTTACSTDNCRQAAAIAGSGRLDLTKIVGARFPLDAAAQAFRAAEDGTTLKVVLEP